MSQLKMAWPEIFKNKDYEYPAGTKQPHAAIADGLIGWGHCKAGFGPERDSSITSFGEGMVKIHKIVGTAMPNKLTAKAKQLKLI